MKKQLKWTLFAVNVYLLFLFILLPMSVFVRLLPENDAISYRGVSGTFLSGAARQVEMPDGQFSNLSWEVQWPYLFTGQLISDIRFGAKDEVSGKGRLGSGLFGNFAENVQLSMPAKLMLKKVTLPITLTGKGALELDINYASVGAPICREFDAKLRWIDGVIGTPAGNIVLADPKALFQCDKGELVIAITEQSEQITADLQLRFLGDRQYQLTGWIKPGARLPAMIKNNLAFIGEKDPKGNYQINLKERY